MTAKPFIHDDFLLQSQAACELYHGYAAQMPIIDYHCHLPPAEIAQDKRWENMAQVWLGGDHYKWRAMRSNGIDERFITGYAPYREKFQKFAETMPYLLRNPLFDWSQLELARYFDIYDLLSPSNASDIYEKASSMLRTREFSIRSLLRKMKVELVCTTDDPTDTLEFHTRMKDCKDLRMLPALRPDNVIKTDDPEKFREYILRLVKAADKEISGFETLVEALDDRHAFFHSMGCRLSDHGSDRFYFSSCSPEEADKIFRALLNGKQLTADETEKYRTTILLELCRMNHKRGWTQQFHVGALRNNNSRMFRKMGPDTGWDSIGAPQDVFRM